jgi:hypothetical protein
MQYESGAVPHRGSALRAQQGLAAMAVAAAKQGKSEAEIRQLLEGSRQQFRLLRYGTADHA